MALRKRNCQAGLAATAYEGGIIPRKARGNLSRQTGGYNTRLDLVYLEKKGSYGSVLEGENLRKTKSRELILEILKDSPPKTVDEIYLLIKSRNGKASMSTVYRTCETLAGKGIVQKSNLLEDGKARYEYRESGHRHHAVCLGCHDIITIDDCPFGQFDKLMESKYGFDVKSHSVEVYGYCQRCRQKNSGNNC